MCYTLVEVFSDEIEAHYAGFKSPVFFFVLKKTEGGVYNTVKETKRGEDRSCLCGRLWQGP